MQRRLRQRELAISFPRSAWERGSRPLCGRLAASSTRSVEVLRSHAERGNEDLPAPSPQSRRRGLTLIELLVVIIILTTLVAAAIPLMAPTSESRRLREASRGVNAFITGAQMKAIEIQRPFGVALKRLSKDTNTSTNPIHEDNAVSVELYYVEQPSPFVGFDETSAVMVALDNNSSGGVGQVLLRFVRRGNDQLQTTDGLPLGWDPDLIPPYTVRPLDVVEVRGTQFRLTDTSWDSGTGFYTAASGTPNGQLVSVPINDTGQLLNVKHDDEGYAIGPDRPTSAPLPDPDSRYWTCPSGYKVLRQPMPVGEPFQMPEGTAIDLRASGVGVNDYFYVPNVHDNSSAVLIMFAPEGRVSRVSYGRSPINQELFDEPVVDNLYLLVGRRENAPPPAVAGIGGDPTLDPSLVSAATTPEQLQEMKRAVNWLLPESHWIVIGSASGRVVTVENAFVDPRTVINEFVSPPTILTRSEELRRMQIIESREFAREMVQLGGR